MKSGANKAWLFINHFNLYVNFNMCFPINVRSIAQHVQFDAMFRGSHGVHTSLQTRLVAT